MGWHTGRKLLSAALLAATTSGAVAQNATMSFPAGCRPGARALVAGVGDLLFHKKLQIQAYAEGGSFAQFWEPVAGPLAAADITYGNLEAPTANGVAMNGREAPDPGRRFDTNVYSATLETLSFNVHPSVLDDIRDGGFDIISTANNHAYDRGPLGVDRTIENFEERAIAFTGTRMRDETNRPWSTLTEANGITIAWLACTFSINGPRDRHDQVLECYDERDDVLAEIAARVAEDDVDAVVLTPHWGSENSHSPSRRQMALARAAIDAGAAAVIGAHPHVVQPWERYISPDGRYGLIIYSTGNFISNQRRQMQRAGMIALVDFVQDNFGRAHVAAAGYIPTWVEIDAQGHRVVVNDGASGWPRAALEQMQVLLPEGNMINPGETWPPALPLQCTEQAVLSPQPAD
jgi:poly-gamma-glutamate synthesis protein (capsule biosynthesis protein)